TGRLSAAINTMLDRIQQAFNARLASEHKVRQFAADASHELRTPLTTIRGYAELYRQGALGPDRLPDAMRRIEQESDRMSRLVAELLGLARAGQGAVLEVADAGPGMSAEHAARAFDRFHRGSTDGTGAGRRDGGSTSPAGDRAGSGLGLSIVQAIARAHGGDAAIESAP